MERAGLMYDEYFGLMKNLYPGEGVYHANPQPIDLDWLERYWPAGG
jgi:hypothetical protein